MKPTLELEELIWSKGYTLIAGIDEAGRGPLAGPVVASSVILPKDLCLIGLNDSKKLSARQRDELFGYIVGYGDVGVSIIDNERIDKMNILNATKYAMIKSVENLPTFPDYLLIDGNFSLSINVDQNNIIGGDAKSMSIAAASIVAKVVRDTIMEDLHEYFPIYGWDKNKGYGTKEHREALRIYGPCIYHRRSFKGVIDDN